jgi:hypothetical protein
MVLTLKKVTEDESDLEVSDLNERNNMLDAIFERDIIMSCRSEVKEEEKKEEKQLANSYRLIAPYGLITVKILLRIIDSASDSLSNDTIKIDWPSCPTGIVARFIFS